MSAPLVELRDVSFGYGRTPVLEHLTFAIGRGEFAALVGPNGAGKTTLLRGILRLIPALAGQIEYHFDWDANPPGYVPQRDTLDPIFPLTAFEVVLMGTYARLPALWPVPRRARQLTSDCLDRVGLSPAARRPYWELSGGQKQRVLIARALAVEPEAMFLDEPTAGVDAEAEAAIIELLGSLNRQQGTTVVLVSHHVGRIASVLTSRIHVDEGRAVKQLAVGAVTRASATGDGHDAQVGPTA